MIGNKASQEMRFLLGWVGGGGHCSIRRFAFVIICVGKEVKNCIVWLY